MVFLRPIHLGHREGIVRIALPLSPWNRKRGGTVWENPALLSRDVPEVGPRGCAKPPKTLARPNQAPSGDTVDHRRHGRSLRGRHIPLWHSQSASCLRRQTIPLPRCRTCCRRVMPISGSRRTSPSSDGRILSFPRICSGWRTEPSPPRMGAPCQVRFRLQYTRTAFLSASQWCFQTAWKELIAQGRVHAESLALPYLTRPSWFRTPSVPACSCARGHRCGGCL